MLTALLILSALTAQPAPDNRVRLYLFTAPADAGFVDEDSKARQDSVADLREALSSSKRVVLVEAREQAKVTVEVLGRQKEASGDYRGSYISNDRSVAVKKHTVRAILSAGTYSKELVGDTETAFKRKAAGHVADAIEKWVKENAAQLR